MHNIKESNKTTNNVELAETFNTFFSKTVPNLNIDNNLGDNIIKPNVTDPVLCAIQKYEKHRSILKIKEMTGTNNLLFSFKFIDRKKYFMNYKNQKAKKLVKEAIYCLKQSKKILTSSQILFTTTSIIHCLVHIFHQIGKMLI